MPSAEKILYFLSSAVSSIIGVAVLSYGMSAEWSSSTMACSLSGNSSFNGYAIIRMGLFEGKEFTGGCNPFSVPEGKVKVFETLGEAGGAGAGIHAVVVVLLVIALVASAACVAFLAMVLYLVNLLEINITKSMLLVNLDAILKDVVVTFLVGFYMLLLYIIFNLFSIILVYLYAHMAYRQRQEQQKPTEDAPKEILMY
ncbi:Clarin-3 [Bagarius yarrelli]|uniref:Clarin-3 n=1 Tax=Bagarius yarrelli TaxID=175774 RepID=A0A556TJJ6_BAGYA|nr:Clarin-3 [Bagarius yarrelli]